MQTDFSTKIIQWYQLNHRDLPWRNTKDPYAIWLSEIILQQTRVSQGLDYYYRFINKYPTVEQLAAAELDEVLCLWQGLGYYSRARNLHAAAKQIAELGHFPTTYKTIRSLKGIGDYTAAAIASFAFNLPHAAIDGNAYRVLSRHFAITLPIDTTEGKKYFAQLAAEILDKSNASQFNQAMMDLGATICTPQNPKCEDCPLSNSCLAHSEHQPSAYPVKQKKIAVKNRYFTYIVVHSNQHLLLQQRTTGDIWTGLYQPPMIESPKPLSIDELLSHPTLKSLLSSQSNLQLISNQLVHKLTHQTLHAQVYSLFAEELTNVPVDFKKINIADIQQYALPQLVVKILELVLSKEGVG